ncbi:MAG: DUF2911 domain-containing protein [Balneolales bacterium]
MPHYITNTLRTLTLALLVGCMITITAFEPVSAQGRDRSNPRVSPNAVVHQTIGTTDVAITYGRPSVRDRVIFGVLVPFGEVWRAGANEATTITFSDDVFIEGEPVEAGTYGLFTIPREDENWTIILNSTANQWGAYDYNNEEDVLRVDVSAEEVPRREQMMFFFEDVDATSGTIVLHWDTARVPFRVEVD